MKIKSEKLIASLLSVVLSAGMMSSVICADAVPVITVGADLTQEQRTKIYEFFGADPDETMVIEINNTQEREYLEGLVSDDIIGTRTLSCSYIMPMQSGGLIVKTANLTYVDENMIANALLTAGVENCQVIATAPFKVSGTGALTGILNSYEKSSGEKLDENKKETATKELIVTSDLINEVINESEESSNNDENTPKNEQGLTEEYIFRFLNELKKEALNGNLTEENAKQLLDKYLEEYSIELKEETYNKLLDYLRSFSVLSYKGKFEEKITSLTDRINEGFNVNFNTVINIGDVRTRVSDGLNAFEKFWGTLKNWLSFVFSAGEIKIDTEAIKEKTQNIFDNINTNIIDYDIIPDELSDMID
ncbi:MAG: DUF1002 domain-containing protein [Oscillospiraceae bacterium]|nr:DUF1002 domain-containing protein [Oscillospiraceae bacterium]